MKYIVYPIIIFITFIQYTFAGWWIFWDFKWDKTEQALKEWNLDLSDIPNMIKWAIDFFIWIAWTVAIIFIIIWAYKILFGSIEGKTEWKDTIFMALWWFVIAILAWFIVSIIINNLSWDA